MKEVDCRKGKRRVALKGGAWTHAKRGLISELCPPNQKTQGKERTRNRKNLGGENDPYPVGRKKISSKGRTAN